MRMKILTPAERSSEELGKREPFGPRHKKRDQMVGYILGHGGRHTQLILEGIAEGNRGRERPQG